LISKPKRLRQAPQSCYAFPPAAEAESACASRSALVEE
jgi:hypothetical protein